MRKFDTIEAFLGYMRRMPDRLVSAGTRGLKEGADIILAEVHAEIGHYQSATGPFAEWKELSEATLYGFRHPVAGWIEGKVELGYATTVEHRPLEREGELDKSYGVTVSYPAAAIGSNDEVAVYQEMGTPDALYPIPPRPILGGSAHRRAEQVAHTVALHVVLTLAGVPLNGPRTTLMTLMR